MTTIYQNRKHGVNGCNTCNNTGVTSPTTSNPSNPANPNANNTPVDISNITCGTQKILSITRIKDKVVVMFDDCSYVTASKDVVDNNLLRDIVEEKLNTVFDSLTSINESIASLKAKEDKDTIYDDTALKERVKVLEDKPEPDLTVYATKKSLNDYVRVDELIVVRDLQNTNDLFKAYPIK